jgi:hypothetical protein
MIEKQVIKKVREGVSKHSETSEPRDIPMLIGYCEFFLEYVLVSLGK